MKSIQKIFLSITISLCMASTSMASTRMAFEGEEERKSYEKEGESYPGATFFTPEDNVRSPLLAGFADQIMTLLAARKVTGEPVVLRDLLGEEFTLDPMNSYLFIYEESTGAKTPYHAAIFTHNGEQYLVDDILLMDAVNARNKIEINKFSLPEEDMFNKTRFMEEIISPIIKGAIDSGLKSLYDEFNKV